VHVEDLQIGDILITPEAVRCITSFAYGRPLMVEMGIAHDIYSSVWTRDPRKAVFVTQEHLDEAEVWRDKLLLDRHGAQWRMAHLESTQRRTAIAQSAVREAQSYGLEYRETLRASGYQQIHPPWLWRLLRLLRLI
jgi:hypothetical protein